MINAIYSAIIQENLLVDQQKIIALFNFKRRANEPLKSQLFQDNHANEVKLSGVGTTNSTNRTKVVEIFD